MMRRVVEHIFKPWCVCGDSQGNVLIRCELDRSNKVFKRYTCSA